MENSEQKTPSMSRRQSSQPVAITSVLRHCALWVTTAVSDLVYGVSDVVYKNPTFNKDIYGTGTGIYCVHGTGDQRGSFSLIANRLLAAGLPDHISSIHLISFDGRFRGKSIKVFSQQFENKVRANGHTSIVGLGHSRGGLVLAYFAAYLALDIRVKVYAISAPFGGSHLALPPLSVFSASVSEMQPGSKFLTELHNEMKKNLSLYYFFAGEEDLIVYPISTFIPEVCDKLKILDGHTHLSIMSSHRLVKYILLLLNGKDQSLSLMSACEELNDYIKYLKQKKHLWSSSAKVNLLEKLHMQLNDMRNGVCKNTYADVATVGDYVAAFLQDKIINNGINPIHKLNSSLNFPFTFWEASSYKYICGLVMRYKNTSLMPQMNQHTSTFSPTL